QRIDGPHLVEGPSKNICGMGKGYFPFRLGEVVFLQYRLLEFLPVAGDAACLIDDHAAHDLVRLDEEKGEVGEDIIDLRPSAGDLDIHLFLVYTVAVTPSFGRNYGFKMRISVTLVTGQVDETAL